MKRPILFMGVALAITLCLTSQLYAQAQGNIADSLLDSFTGRTAGWWGILQSKAFGIFKLVLIIDVCLFGFRMAMPGGNVGEIFKEFISLLVFAGFIALVIANYQEWSKAVAINGLKPLASELSGGFSVDPGQPVAMAAKIVKSIIPVLKKAGITDFGTVLLYVLCMLIIIGVFVLISALVIIVTCEFHIVANIGVLLIGLGGSRIFKDYAVNVMRYVLSVAVKLFVLQLIVNIGFAIISMKGIDAGEGAKIADVNFENLFYLIGQAVMLFALAKTLPDSCAGMLSGAAIGGGNPLGGMAMSAATMVGGMAGGVAAGAAMKAGAAGMSMASTAKGAYEAAREKGASGIGGTLGAMKESFSEARGAAKDARKEAKDLQAANTPGSIRSQLRSQANAARAQQDAMRQAALESASAPATPEVPEPEPAPPLESESLPDMPSERRSGFKESDDKPIWQR